MESNNRSATPRPAGRDAEITCWVVTDGTIGMEIQAVGLAEALGLHPVVKRIRLRTPWRQLTPHLRLGQRYAFAPDGDPIQPPWPDLLIATGRQSAATSLYVRARSRVESPRPTLTIQIQDPLIEPAHFDLMIAPRHDNLAGDNVLVTRGALHRITPAILMRDAARLAPRIKHLPRPYVVVLLGGRSTAYRMTPREIAPLAAQLAALARTMPASILVTPSRRTGEACLKAMRSGLRGVANFIWDGSGDNPYFGMLGLADFILVTRDSVNMVSEACTTGKPVYVIDLPGGGRRSERFHRSLREDGLTRPFTGTLESYRYQPLDDMRAAANRVRALLRQRLKLGG